MRKYLIAAILGSVLTGAAAAAPPALTPEQIIAARQGGMGLVDGIVEAMKAAVASGTDPKPFQDGAQAMAAWARLYGSLFPDGTQTGHNTKARPEIWTDRAGFEKALASFGSAADQAAAAAKAGDKTAFAAAFKQLGGTCGSCHRAFKSR